MAARALARLRLAGRRPAAVLLVRLRGVDDVAAAVAPATFVVLLVFGFRTGSTASGSTAGAATTGAATTGAATTGAAGAAAATTGAAGAAVVLRKEVRGVCGVVE